MYALPALTTIAGAAIRAQFETNIPPMSASETIRWPDRMRERLADVLERASHAVAPARPRPAH